MRPAAGGLLLPLIAIRCHPEKIATHPVFIHREKTLPFISRHITVEDLEESLLDFFVGIWLKLLHGATVFGIPNQI